MFRLLRHPNLHCLFLENRNATKIRFVSDLSQICHRGEIRNSLFPENGCKPLILEK